MNHTAPTGQRQGTAYASGTKTSVYIAVVARFALISVFLFVFLASIFISLSAVRQVKVEVQNENDAKVDLFRAALLDPTLTTNLEANATIADAKISALEEELDTTIAAVTFFASLSVFLMALSIFETVSYVKKHIMFPLIHFHDEALKLAKGELSLDFSCSSRATEVFGLGQALTTSSRELNRIVSVIQIAISELSEKNFWDLPPANFPGEFASIEKGFQYLSKTVADTLREIVVAAEEVSLGAGQVSSGAQCLAEGSSEQASSVDHLSTTISEISELVTDTADSADEARNLSEHTESVLQKSHREMNELHEAMEIIERSATDIVQVIKTIDDIAFQTNILALNAAIEAARAGKFGRSFAVVADEVRQLAMKSAEAADSTSGLIDRTLEAIRSGSDLVERTNVAFADVQSSSSKIITVVRHIADSTNHQAKRIEDICIHVSEISQVISNNSATSEDSAAASEELSGQAELMHQMLDAFQLGGDIPLVEKDILRSIK